MLAGDDRVDRVVHQVDELDALVDHERHEVVLVGERELEVAGLERREPGAWVGLGQAQLDIGMPPAELRDRGGHDRGVGRRKRRHPKRAAREPGESLQVGLGGAQAREDVLRVRNEREPRLRQPHRAGAAFHERHARLALERRELLRDCGGREGERLRGGRDRAADGNLSQDAHAPDVEHQQILASDEGSALVVTLVAWQRLGA
jgi:hypothetical protein